MCRNQKIIKWNKNVKFRCPLFTAIRVMAMLAVSASVSSAITVVDDSGESLSFSQPVKRIISLAPHITELLYAAGAEKQILGTVSYSDYPPAAKQLPVIGSYVKADYERVLAAQPEVVMYWKSGNPENMVNGIRKLNLKLFNSEPDNFEDVAASLIELGKLLGTEKIANLRAQQYLQRLSALRKKYSNKNNKKVRVFYQVWNQPLMTINQQHLINDVIDFCGGVNVFAALDNIAPTVDIESVMQKNPDVIVAGMAKGREQWLHEWQKWQTIDAVKNKALYSIDASLIVRQTPRILDGTEKMCELLQQYRDEIVKVQ